MSKLIKYIVPLATLIVGTQAIYAATVSSEPYGKTPDGKEVTQYTFNNKNGVTVKVITIAGVIREINLPDKNGKIANIVLGLPDAEAYATKNDPHFGAIIGRYANRIANGRFTLNGKTYQLPLNDGQHTLHGGPSTFAQDVWSAKIIPQKDPKTASVEMSYLSPDGQNGFPGNVTTTVTYSLNDDNELTLHYSAQTDQDTVVNLTNHSYFNLAGENSGSVENQQVQIFAFNYTPTDKHSIPTGQIVPVVGTPLDFRQMKAIGKDLRNNFEQLNYARGYDHNWVLDNYSPNATQPRLAARAYDPESGRTLELSTTQPGLQFYTSNSLDGSVIGSSGKAYRQTDGFAFEAEHFPNSPNIPSFPSTVLKKGDTFNATTVYKFGVQKNSLEMK
ncbi:aldose epimerase family protein [Acinetobacter stercoris]|uniref:Aldose 1-epimerase n=1 Tax=Acinetobacter stercoris TaxID=2126983 RepID=A0A2U3N123_9GAMM|nr:aldose epimerase family protein [Acinetobacter stercoris]SPL71249.1 Aldose 1-epimerase precursor [Acinetobacter stercoris]